jgi:hypothetical protein
MKTLYPLSPVLPATISVNLHQVTDQLSSKISLRRLEYCYGYPKLHKFPLDYNRIGSIYEYHRLLEKLSKSSLRSIYHKGKACTYILATPQRGESITIEESKAPATNSSTFLGVHQTKKRPGIRCPTTFQG